MGQSPNHPESSIIINKTKLNQTHIYARSAEPIQNELHGPSGTGSGGILNGLSFDTVSKVLSIDVGWGTGNGFTDLTGSVTGIHIHGPADMNNTAGVLINFGASAGFNNSASVGGLVETVVLDATNEARLMSGNSYLNVHTAANPSGEIRGNLIAVPEPTMAAGLGLFLAGVTILRRRR